jgi:2-aminoadipate transaminase
MVTPMKSTPATAGIDAFRFARSMAAMRQSELREILVSAAQPGVISFAVGLPAAELFPAAELAEANASLLPAHPDCLQYDVPSVALKDQVVELMVKRGVRCRREQVFLTSGAQQAMDLLSRLLLDPGGQVLIEETVYSGLQMAIKGMEPQILTVATDLDTGLDLDAVEDLLARGARPAFVYVIPSGHNPLGVSLPLAKLHRLAELARRYRVPILEDDAYGFLNYDDDPRPALRALEERWVFYLGSFSKILAPALRAGWMVVPEELIPRLSALKHATDLDTPSFTHWTIASYLASGKLPAHLERLRGEYRRRRDVMLQALASHFPPEVLWNRPASGLFIWVELPAAIDATALLAAAIKTERVAFSPGDAFAAGGSRHARHCLRLNFSHRPPDQIEEGIRRLARAVLA